MKEPSTVKGLEYWRWQEYHRIMPNKKWTSKDIITAGVDVGSVGSKAAIMINGEAYSWSIMRTGSNSPESANKALDYALEGTGLKVSDLKYIVGTGYGRVNVPMANKAITEIACHGKGANYIWGPSVRHRARRRRTRHQSHPNRRNRQSLSFLMNDKCAAGTGRGMEVFADLLQIPIEEIGDISLKVEKEPDPVSCTCVAFAKTEAMGLLRKGWSKEKVLAAYTRAMAVRMANLINRVGLEKELVITGGQSKNIGIVSRIEVILGVKCLPMPNWRENGIRPHGCWRIGRSAVCQGAVRKSAERHR